MLRFSLPLLFLLLPAIQSAPVTLYGQSDLPHEQVCTMLEGHFEPVEVPEDLYSAISWYSTPVFIDESEACYLYHERYQKSTPSVPVLEMVIKIESADAGVSLSYLYIPKNIRQHFSEEQPPEIVLENYGPSDLSPIEGQNLILKKRFGRFSGSTQYPTVFRGSSYGIIEMSISKELIYNWTRYFKDDGSLVYGSEKSGYYLKRVTKEG